MVVFVDALALVLVALGLIGVEDDGLGGEAMAEGVEADAFFAFFGAWAGGAGALGLGLDLGLDGFGRHIFATWQIKKARLWRAGLGWENGGPPLFKSYQTASRLRTMRDEKVCKFMI